MKYIDKKNNELYKQLVISALATRVFCNKKWEKKCYYNPAFLWKKIPSLPPSPVAWNNWDNTVRPFQTYLSINLSIYPENPHPRFPWPQRGHDTTTNRARSARGPSWQWPQRSARALVPPKPKEETPRCWLLMPGNPETPKERCIRYGFDYQLSYQNVRNYRVLSFLGGFTMKTRKHLEPWKSVHNPK